MHFPHLFQPARIGTLEVPNRIIGSPMERNYCTAEGRVTQRYVDYMAARAQGGAGLLYTEATYVDPRGKGRTNQMGLHEDSLVPDLARLVRAVHAQGGRVGPALNYGGRVVQPWISGLESRAPSAVAYAGAGGHVPRALSLDEIMHIVQCFADAARRAAEAGCDFIGLHSAHGYLMSQFLSPWCNQRNDAYGGNLQGRMRFVLEVVRAVRQEVGGRLPIVYRISGDEHQDGGLSLADVCALVPHLEAAGVDLVDVSAGMYETNWWITQPMEMPQGVLAPLAQEVRKHARVPVSVSGRITDPSVAEHLLATGVCDFVTLGRALHADPDFPAKAHSGRSSEICTCIACNQGCSDLHARGLPIVCLVNTHSGRERENAIRTAAKPKRVTVVGGGPAGLEAARVLALRGHCVTLFEREAEPGGQMLLSRHAPGREEFAGHLPWLVGAAQRAGATLRVGQAVTAAQVLQGRPDVVVVATGARLGLPAVPGVWDSPVVDAYEVLRRPRAGLNQVLVMGGGIRGVAVARVLAPCSAAVVLVDAAADLLTDIASRSRRFQMQALQALANVTVHVGTTVEHLSATQAVLCKDGMRWAIPITLVVPTNTLLPEGDLADELLALAPGLHLQRVGDCAAPRDALQALHEAADLAHRI